MERKSLISVGYWRDQKEQSKPQTIEQLVIFAVKEIIGERLPWPGDYVDEKWDESDRNRIAQYLDSANDIHHEMGFSLCRLCGKENGTTDKSDGVFVWPQGLSHYVRDHSVRLPKIFAQHIRSNLARSR